MHGLAISVLETRTTYCKKEQHFLIGQLRTCRIFMLCYIQPIFLTNLLTSLVYTKYVWKALFLRFYLNSRSCSEINSVCSNEWALYHPQH